MKFVSIRKVDELGRLVLPIEIRRFYDLNTGDALSVKSTGFEIVLSKDEEADTERCVDELGRIVLPKEIRDKFRIQAKDDLAIIPCEDGIHLCPAADVKLPKKPIKKPRPQNADVFEKDYTENRRRYREMMSATDSDALLAKIKDAGIFAEIDRRFLALPHIVNPMSKAAYDKALEMLDVWAMVHSGKIYGEVSYEEFDARIVLTFPFFEFVGDNIDTLKFIAQTAKSVLFDVTPFGNIEMVARFPYFEDTGGKDKIVEEVLSEHPELMDDILASADFEKDAILSNPKLSCIIEDAAEQLGITPREYLEYLDRVLEENPGELLQAMHKEFQKDQAKQDESGTATLADEETNT